MHLIVQFGTPELRTPAPYACSTVLRARKTRRTLITNKFYPVNGGPISLTSLALSTQPRSGGFSFFCGSRSKHWQRPDPARQIEPESGVGPDGSPYESRGDAVRQSRDIVVCDTPNVLAMSASVSPASRRALASCCWSWLSFAGLPMCWPRALALALPSLVRSLIRCLSN